MTAGLPRFSGQSAASARGMANRMPATTPSSRAEFVRYPRRALR